MSLDAAVAAGLHGLHQFNAVFGEERGHRSSPGSRDARLVLHLALIEALSCRYLA